MTDTINNVPRELLERARAAVASTNTSNWSSDLLRDIHAILSDPSPAGVDGLNTDRNAAFKACPESGCDWGSFYLGWKARGEVEQAIIDGLRGEVADLLSMLATVSKAGLRVRTERDQQAQRICELDGLLREWRRMFDGGLESGQLGVLRGHTDAPLQPARRGVMKTFKWKFWRFAWMTHANWGWTTTVIDGSGRWVKIFGCLCFLAEPRDYQ